MIARPSQFVMVFAGALLMSVAACSREPAARGPAASDAATATSASAAPGTAALPGAPTTSATQDAALVISDGSPRIADSPGGVHIQYRVYGRGEPLVVLIHGWSCDSNYWSAQVADLKTRHTVVTVDLAGHGGSGANRSDWSMPAFAADVAAVVEVLKDHPKVVLVGHSMGGPVAIEAARRIGPRVVGVIGLDTLKNVGLPQPSAAETEKRLAAFEADFIGSTRGLVGATMFTAKSDPVLVRRIVDDMSQAPPAVAIPAIRQLNAWDGVAALKALPVPVVVINSDLNGVTDEARISSFAPRFRVITVAGLGHFLMMEDPARVNPILDAQVLALSR